MAGPKPVPSWSTAKAKAVDTSRKTAAKRSRTVKANTGKAKTAPAAGSPAKEAAADESPSTEAPAVTWTSAEPDELRCGRSRRKLWQAGEGWVVKTVTVCR
nr:hypothetical protein [Methylobacterium bullatum]